MLTQLTELLATGLKNAAVLLPILAFVGVLFIGLALLLLFSRHRKTVRRRLDDEGRSDLPDERPRESSLLRFMESVGNFVSHGHASTSLWEQLMRAGYMSRGAPAVYTGVKILLFVAALTLLAMFLAPTEQNLSRKILVVCLGGVVPFFLPNFYVLYKERKRRMEIRAYLPDVVDLLEICVSSGLGLDMAWNIVADEIHHVSSVLGTAMDMTTQEIHLGASRTDAMRNMAVRTGANQLASLAAILVQSEQFGTSVAAALREFAESMREERNMVAEEHAEKMAVKLVVPMVLFIFPAIIVITVGPAIINIAHTLFTH
jgi:tight adherence protein C